MNNNVVLDADKYPGAVLYAKSHNISFKQLVENLLMRYQVPSDSQESSHVETEDFLDSIDGNLMKHTFEAIHLDYLAGKCKPHEDVVSEMIEKRGWK